MSNGLQLVLINIRHPSRLDFVSQCGVIIEPALFYVLDVDQSKHNYVTAGMECQRSIRALKVDRAGRKRVNKALFSTPFG